MTATKGVEARDRDGRTALINAAFRGDLALVRSWLAAGADVNAADRGGWTALHAAASCMYVAVAEALLDSGADIEAEDVHGKPPLSVAVFESRGKGEMIRLLLARGADPLHANKYGVSPLSLAQQIANYDVAQFFPSK